MMNYIWGGMLIIGAAAVQVCVISAVAAVLDYAPLMAATVQVCALLTVFGHR